MIGCQYCTKTCKKDGKQKDGTQKYRCKSCGRWQQKSYKYRAKTLEKRKEVLSLLVNNCGFTGIQRVTHICVNTIMKIVFKAADELSEPELPQNGTYEIDEMRAYKRKGRDIWVSYAFERKSGKVIGISVGKRDEPTLRVTANEVLRRNPKKIYTDGYGVYRTILPEKLHKVSKKMLWKVERKHLHARDRLKMLNRSTLSFVRKPATLLACLKLLFWSKESAYFY